jgi:hypothetical protein
VLYCAPIPVSGLTPTKLRQRKDASTSVRQELRTTPSYFRSWRCSSRGRRRTEYVALDPKRTLAAASNRTAPLLKLDRLPRLAHGIAIAPRTELNTLAGT